MILVPFLATCLLLAMAWWAAKESKRPLAAWFPCAVGVVFGLAWPVVFFNSIAVLLVAAGCAVANARPRTFVRTSFIATLAVYLGLFALSDGHEPRYDELRRQYPYEPIGNRLAYERQRPQHPAAVAGEVSFVSPAASARLEKIETLVTGRSGSRRNHHLREIHELHDDVVQRFVNSPGFGPMRRIGPSSLTLKLPPNEPIPQPAGDDPYFKRLQEGKQPAAGSPPDAPVPAEEALWEMHRSGLVDFVNPEGFGYVKDRDHVAGFQEHQFREVPSIPGTPWTTWRVARVELVSLLRFESPAVYVAEYLPRMDRLRKARTRPLDEFEANSLDKLRKGEDLVTHGTAARIRVFGSLRAGKQCLECHDARRGDLLGAFTYDLRPERGKSP